MSTVKNEDAELLALARARRLLRSEHHAIAGWYGRRGGSSRRVYVCYVCGAIIDTESAKYPMTSHAKKRICDEAQKHLDEDLTEQERALIADAALRKQVA